MYDPALLRSFVAVAETRSFTGAGRLLGISQSTVSQQVRRLEEAVGRRLVARDTHSVALTPDGEAMLGFARKILDLNRQVERYFAGAELRGTLRFGASEDFVLSRLAEVLSDFARRNPSVDLEITVASSGILNEMLQAGELDLVLAKRRIGQEQGTLVRREALVWAAANPALVVPERPVPLIAFPPPSITRAVAIETLERANVPWRIVCTSASLGGLRAAAVAGLGVLVQPRSMLPPGLVELRTGRHLPELEEVEFVLASAGRELAGPARELAADILAGNARLSM
ncbi:LysR substrate-binding domain-containing protein [Chelatococcus composti]|uniref:DNA-binding transcriptional LysR family regulator n=1 Tax=Chelatococcus composti TaxID=1743235 RepID=A0A841KBD6_9HYPH|nr:LysR substrate-binding domain-containing protein [Chelatococcus composti]MBB6168194.1 DNA-binding transcriptional LysR family regulator [Chelatococcus composti]MBS7736720.1 LysR family transcriptional regulator [Chelatococcus composti]GGG38164.1 LysR family transcriptional regulator [Chelatococcus composti]